MITKKILPDISLALSILFMVIGYASSFLYVFYDKKGADIFSVMNFILCIAFFGITILSSPDEYDKHNN